MVEEESKAARMQRGRGRRLSSFLGRVMALSLEQASSANILAYFARNTLKKTLFFR
jgi:hypothetical protein